MVYAQTEVRFNTELEASPNLPSQRGFSIETFASANHSHVSRNETRSRGSFNLQFSTTLLVTIQCVRQKARVSEKSTEFLLSLGATINMDGTALDEAVVAIIIAQAIHQNLELSQQVVVTDTTRLTAIGATGIPEADLVTMLIIFNAVGLLREYIALILSFDWLLDRFRTAVNVPGDSMGPAVVEKTIKPSQH